MDKGHISVIWLHEPEESKYYWERDWLRYLLEDLPAIHFDTTDAPSIPLDNTLLIFGGDIEEARVQALLDIYIKPDRAYALIHLSDENLSHDVTRYTTASVAFRNYYRPDTESIAFGIGYKRGFWDHYTGRPPSDIESRQRSYVWSFIGDVKNPDREDMIKAFSGIEPHFMHRISGWDSSDSLSTQAYRDKLLDTVFAPSPHGAFSQDCFRTYEALEAGCVPITLRESETALSYYDKLFAANGFNESVPFPQFRDWEAAARFVKKLYQNNEAEALRLKCHGWWSRYKAYTKKDFERRLRAAFSL